MPQTANSFHIYVRKGGYEPSIGFHHIGTHNQILSAIDLITDQLQAMTPVGVAIVRWEWQNEKGFILDEGPLALNGTLAKPYASFTDCTHISWVSSGPGANSSCFAHPRPHDAYLDDTPQPYWVGLVGGLAAAVVQAGCTDSEGVSIQSMRSHKPSRRRRVRLAP